MDDAFKIPILPSTKPQLHPEDTPDDQISSGDLNSSETDKSSEITIKPKNAEIPYKIPKWDGQLPEGNYSFEILKNGLIIGNVKDLQTKSYWIIGRMKLNMENSLIAEHPSVSRHHAVLQYKHFSENSDEKESTPESGWFIYDLDSTHGTFVNKNRAKPRTYVRVRVGYQIKFGSSTRCYILNGPSADEEEASEFTVTELKEQKAQKVAELKLQQEEQMKKKEKEDGISWGISEDADEENDLTENPFAVTNNEEIFVKDPKKTLRGFFEREGLDLEYKCDEMSAGNFVCKIELPLDDEMGKPMICEVKHKGKKKECVEQCALEACRILDRHGMLRQATHEPRRSRKVEDDDSDDDGFYDRTGDVEKKKLKKSGQSSQSDALTYEELLEKEKEIVNEIEDKEKRLSSLISAEKKQRQQDDEDLDSFMSNLDKFDNKIDKFSISTMKTEIQKLRTDLQNTLKLIQVAKPSINLESLVKPGKSALPLWGKRTSLGRNFLQKKSDPVTTSTSQTEKIVDSKFEVEEDDDDDNVKEIVKNEKVQENVQETEEKTFKKVLSDSKRASEKTEKTELETVDEPLEKKRKFEERKDKVKSSDTKKETLKEEAKLPQSLPQSSSTEDSSTTKKKKSRLRIKNQYRQHVDMNDDDEFIDEEKVSTWVPPDDQKGDGFTHLNDKFGY